LIFYSKRFDQVYEEITTIWHSQQYLIVREYYTRSPLIPPIALLYDIYRLGRITVYAIRHSCFKKSSDREAKVFSKFK
jgi:hypothetical protein